MQVKIIREVKKSTGHRTFKPGAVIEVSEKYGERLIAQGDAVEMNVQVAFEKLLEKRLQDIAAQLAANEEE